MTNEERVFQIQNGFSVTDNLQALYLENQTMIKRYVKPFSTYYNEDIEDLMQEAYFGLVEATKRFDAGEGVKFLSYARFWIVRTIKKYLEEKGGCLRLPQYLNERIMQYNRYVQQFIACNGREPKIDEIKADLGYSEVQVERIKRYSASIVSFDKEIQNDNGESLSLISTIPDQCDIEQDVLDKAYREQMQGDVKLSIEKYLNPRQQTIIKDIYYNGFTMVEIADKMGLSKQRIEQIKNRALSDLKCKARKLLYQYCEIEGYAYNGTLTNFKRRGSIVEYLAVKNMILEGEREKISNIIDGVKSC